MFPLICINFPILGDGYQPDHFWLCQSHLWSMPGWVPVFWFPMIFCSQKMLPKSFLFHSLSLYLVCFSILCRRYIFYPWNCKSSSHHFLMLLMKSRWESQIFSNLKGLFLGESKPLISNWIGQWSEPLKGRTLAVISLSISISSYNIINLSNLEAT